MSELPQHPFIDPVNAEGTFIQVDAVLAFLQEYEQIQAQSTGYDSPPVDGKHIWGKIYVLDGVRTAVRHLMELSIPAAKVTKLEVGDE